jgi:hypothetical protein
VGASPSQELEDLNKRVVSILNAGQPVPPEMLQRINQLQQQVDAPGGPKPAPRPGELDTQPAGGRIDLPSTRQGARSGPMVPSGFEGELTLLNVLTDLAKKANVNIMVDITVKPDPVRIPVQDLEGLPVAQALQMIVTSMQPPYAYKQLDERTFKVYRPISNNFPGVDLLQALQDISASAGVPVIPDPNITGDVNAGFDDLSLDQALQMVLAGKPYEFKRIGDYYLVAERAPTGMAFPEISETRYVRLNYTQATRAKALLSPVFAPYVQAEPADAMDPNDRGNMLIITAPAQLLDRICATSRKSTGGGGRCCWTPAWSSWSAAIS